MKTFEITKAQFNRAVSEFRSITKEQVEVNFYDGAFWVFGSELATLRLFKKHAGSNGITADYSKNLSTFYFKMEAPSFCGEMSTN